MKKAEIKVGGCYYAKVNNVLRRVEVLDIQDRVGYGGRAATTYVVKNLTTGRTTRFHSSQKFQKPAPTTAEVPEASSVADPTPAGSPTPRLSARLANSGGSVTPAGGLPPHVIVEALAGTGKTTTLVEGLKLVVGQTPTINPSPQQQAVWEQLALSQGLSPANVCFVAFNKSIATELQQRVPAGCNAMTMHSMGFRAVTAQYGRVRVVSDRVQEIIARLLDKDVRTLRKQNFELVRAVEALVGQCKRGLVHYDAEGRWLEAHDPQWVEVLDGLTSHFDIELNGNRDRVYELVPTVLAECRDVNQDKCIDFDDMIWLPVALDLPLARYDLLLVDECQDLNRCQQQLALRAGRRLVFCGDRQQAIYGFTGADAQSMETLKNRLTNSHQGCQSVPLTVTRRCGRAIVAEAQQIVPEFEAHETNGPGRVLRASFKSQGGGYEQLVQDGDMCLCRVNAPLVSQCFRFLRQGRKATIQGRDIGQGLISIIKKMRADSVEELIAKVTDYRQKEIDRENAKRNPSEAKLIALDDKCDCLLAFADGADTVEDVVARIEEIFQDNQREGIKFSSIHRAKGLEAKRVFLLEPDNATVPHPMARSKWQREQEMNLRYVAITRAIEELVYVS